MLYVRQGTTISFDDGFGQRSWSAQEVALSRYHDMQGPTVFVSNEAPMRRVFAEAAPDGTLTMRGVSTIQGETSDGGGMGDIGVPGAMLGTVTVDASALYDG